MIADMLENDHADPAEIKRSRRPVATAGRKSPVYS